VRILRRIFQGNAFFAWMLLLPATIILVTIRVWPLLQGISLSLTNRRLLNDRPLRFIGLENFINLFQDKDYWSDFGFTLFYTLGTVILSYLLGLVISLLMNMEIKGRGAFRMLLMIPWVIPNVVAAYIWRYALNDQIGIINIILQALHITTGPIGFLASSTMAQIMVTVIAAWKNFPFMGLVLLAGLQNVPEETKEAAKIDGANAFQVFAYVVWPELKGVTIMCTTLMFIWTFNSFDTVFLLTGGGPNYSTYLISIQAYFTAFSKMNMGYASTMATTMLVFMTVVTVLYMRFVRGKEN
jgi:multiple sugar transport system permease protein